MAWSGDRSEISAGRCDKRSDSWIHRAVDNILVGGLEHVLFFHNIWE